MRQVDPHPEQQSDAADARLPQRSLRRHFLLPFAVGVALLSLAVGVVAAWGAREAAETELENRARTAARIFDEAMVAKQARLEREAFGLAANRDIVRALPRGHRLDDLDIPGTLSNRFDYVAVTGPRGEHVFASRLADWGVLHSPRLLDRVARGIAQSGIVVTRDGTPALFAAAPVHVPSGGRDGAMILAEPITAGSLEELARPLDLALDLTTSRGRRISSLAGSSEPGARVRAYPYRARLASFAAGSAQLTVTLSTAPLRRATAAAAMTAAVTALGLALTLLLLVVLLLERAVVRPLHALGTAIAQVKRGDYDVRIRFGRSRELAAAADALQRMATIVGKQQAQLHKQASRDPLTQLSNHAAFHASLDAAVAVARRDGTEFGLLAVDVDLFKQINDRHGHPFGDAVLRAIADELRSAIRDGDTAARVGGDEFAVLLPGAGAASAAEAAERIRERMRSVTVDQEQLSISIGVASYPAHGADAAELMEVADQALYASKRAGRGQTRRYDELAAAEGTTGASGGERGQLLALLEREDLIVPVFQPIVSLRSGAIVRYEALARFPPEFDRRPDQWFAQAHRCHLGAELEARALEAALAAPGLPDGVELAVNVSPDALTSPRLLSVLPGRLDGIVIEITEQQRVTDADAVRSRLGALRSRGARIALDDAGEGYAGLGQLLRVEPEIIKLDRSLIDGLAMDPARLAIIEVFVRLAERTGAELCAEGIESIEQALLLARLGVTHGQGYALARPGPPWPGVAPDVRSELIAQASELEGAAPLGPIVLDADPIR